MNSAKTRRRRMNARVVADARPNARRARVGRLAFHPDVVRTHPLSTRARRGVLESIECDSFFLHSKKRSARIANSSPRGRCDRHHATRANTTRDETISTTKSSRAVPAFSGASLRARVRWRRRRARGGVDARDVDRSRDRAREGLAGGSATRGAWTRVLRMADACARGRRARVARRPRDGISRFRGFPLKPTENARRRARQHFQSARAE